MPESQLEMLFWDTVPQNGIIFHWKIRQFVLHMKNTSGVIDSETFISHDIPSVKWFLRLYISHNYRGEQILTLSFRRAEDLGPNCVQVSYKLVAVDSNMRSRIQKCESKRRTERFYNSDGGNQSAVADEKYDLFWVKNDFHCTGHITVACYVYPFEEVTDIPRKLRGKTESELEMLRKDICHLYERRLLLDVELRAGGKKIRVHKSLLCTRLPVLAQELGIEESKEGFVRKVVPGMDWLVLKLLVQYMYTGNLNADITDLSGALYLAIERYIPNYERKLFPTLRMRYSSTFVTMHREYFRWCIRNFQSLKPGVNLLSPVISIDSIDGLEFLIAFYLEEDDDCDQNVRMLIRRITPSGGKTITVFFQVSILDQHGSQATYFQGYRRYKAYPDWILPTIIKRNSLLDLKYKYLYMDSLSLQCEMVVSDDEEGKTKVVDTFYAEENSPIETEDAGSLQDDLENLFHTRKCSDMWLRIGDANEPAHLALLCARSPMMSRLHSKKEILVVLSDVDHEDMKNMLYYIYAGKLNDMTYERVVGLYKMAEKFEILRLKEKCSVLLISFINAENAEELLILATKHCDEKLKSRVQKYMRLLEDEVSETCSGLAGSVGMARSRTDDTSTSESGSFENGYQYRHGRNNSALEINAPMRRSKENENLPPVAEGAPVKASGTRRFILRGFETMQEELAGRSNTEQSSKERGETSALRKPRKRLCSIL